jgi:hypothetical protein
MWKIACVVAAFESLIYGSIVLAMMIRAGVGSGVPFVLSPLVWLFLAVRLWGGVWIAAALSSAGGLQFIVAAAAIGLLSSIALSVILGAGMDSWSNFWLVPPSAFAHIAAAWLVWRSQLKASQSG